eukprot:9154579-Pyramimonas_sp.AAC.1
MSMTAEVAKKACANVVREKAEEWGFTEAAGASWASDTSLKITSMMRHLYNPQRQFKLGQKDPKWFSDLKKKQGVEGPIEEDSQPAVSPAPAPKSAAPSPVPEVPPVPEIGYDRPQAKAWRKFRHGATELSENVFEKEGSEFMWAKFGDDAEYELSTLTVEEYRNRGAEVVKPKRTL